MTYIDLINDMWERFANHNVRVTASTQLVYAALLHVWNGTTRKYPRFKVNYQYVVSLCSIMPKTYYRALSDLEMYGFIKYEKGTNQHSYGIVELCALTRGKEQEYVEEEKEDIQEKKPSSRTVGPTWQEVAKKFEERGLPTPRAEEEAKKFLNLNEGLGWRMKPEQAFEVYLVNMAKYEQRERQAGPAHGVGPSYGTGRASDEELDKLYH